MSVKKFILLMACGMGGVAAGVCNSSELYYWSSENGKLVVKPRHSPVISAQKGTAIQSPDIGARINTIAGIADVADEAKKTFGYWSEAQRLEGVREQAEQALRNSIPAEDGAAGLIRVWSDRKANPMATPVDPDFVGRYQVDRPVIGATIFEAVEILDPSIPRADGLPVIEPANSNRSRNYPVLSYTLVAERSGGVVNVWMVEPETLLNLYRRGYEREGFQTGKQLSEAERRHRAALERSKYDRSPEAQQAVAESQRLVESSRSAYESQVRSREEREGLTRATLRACSNGVEACAKARDEEIRWYDEASKRQVTGRVLQDDTRGGRGTGVGVDFSDTFGAEIPRPLPGEESSSGKDASKALPYCGVCAFASSSNSYLERHKTFAKELTAGMKGMHPAEFRKVFREYKR